jgi:uncharacterized protein YcgL (UPF0745 family)
MIITLNRQDVLKAATAVPLAKLTLKHLRGSAKVFAEANAINVHENGKVKIMKDRQGWYLQLKRDDSGLVSETELNAVKRH